MIHERSSQYAALEDFQLTYAWLDVAVHETASVHVAHTVTQL